MNNTNIGSAIENKMEGWYNLLIEHGNKSEFENILFNSRNFSFALMNYRKVLLDRKAKVELNDFIKAFDSDIEDLQKFINNTFLEYYTLSEIKDLLRLKELTNTKVEYIYDCYLDNTESYILSTLNLS